MARYTTVGKVNIFTNQNKTSDKHPTFTGKGEIEGIGEVQVSAWDDNKTKSGTPYISLSFSKKEDELADILPA